MFRHADVVCLCASCGSSQCCVLHDLQFVNAGRGCNRRPYRRGILQSRSHNCFIGSHECLLRFTPSCCSECLIDTIGPLQESSQGNKYIVAITDHFSKWTEAAAPPQKTAARVADFLYTTVCGLGCMDTLISDQRREFVNSVVDHLLERMSRNTGYLQPTIPRQMGNEKGTIVP